MKFTALEKAEEPVKVVSFRLGNAPLVADLRPEDPLPDDGFTAKVGLRTLTGEQAAEVYKNARAAAQKAGCKEWLDSDPVCRLYEQAYTVLVACVDPDSEGRGEPFFDGGIDQVMKSPSLGLDNIAYLYEQHGIWQDESGCRISHLTIDEIYSLMAKEAARPENMEGPFERLRPGARRTYVRTTAALLSSLLTDKSSSSSLESESSPN